MIPTESNAAADGEPLVVAELVDADERDGEVSLIARQETAERFAVAMRPSLLRRGWRAFWSGVEWLFGGFCLIVGLAVLATIPVAQLLSLGYLLEVSGRVTRGGRLTAGFVGVRKAARLGTVVLASWLLIWPPRFVASLLNSSRLIDPDSRATRGLTVLLIVLSVLLGVHIASACWRGGRLRHFLLPAPIWLARNLFRSRAYAEARDALWRFVVDLRPAHYFSLGLRGFLGGLIVLAIPVSLLALGRQAPLVGFLGGVLLAIAAAYLPFLQARFAAEDRFRALLEFRAVRQVYARAPVAFFFALLTTLLFALPLYLLKIEITPREATWLPSLFFVVFMFPARLMVGWAYGRGARGDGPRHWFFRHGARLGVFAVASVYALITFSSQYTSWYGVWSLYEQHAFLVPAPFLGN